MIRSLVVDRSDTNAQDEQIVKRNLSSERIESSYKQGYMMWIDIVDGTDDEIQWVEELLNLSVVVVDDLKRADTHPTLIVYPDYLFITLFEPAVKGYQITGKEIHCIINDHTFVTVRSETAKSVDEAYNRVTRSPDVWQQDTAYFLYLTARHMIDAYYPVLDQISNELNRLEERLLEGDSERSGSQRTVHLRKQQLIKLRQMVAPQREVLSSVVGEKRLSQSAETRDLFRHLYERLLRVYDVIDSQRELCNAVLDTIQSQEGKELVEVVNRLTILSMIFLPLTFFTGLLELNFATTSDPVVLPVSGGVLFYALLTVLGVTVGWMGYFFKSKKWI